LLLPCYRGSWQPSTGGPMTRCRAAKQDNLEDQENIAKYSPASSPYTAQAFMDVVSPTGAVHTGQIVLQNSDKTQGVLCTIPTAPGGYRHSRSDDGARRCGASAWRSGDRRQSDRSLRASSHGHTRQSHSRCRVPTFGPQHCQRSRSAMGSDTAVAADPAKA
jgi:hypothetical protein